MTPFFTLWDLETNNMVGTFGDGARALRAAAGMIDANGSDYADSLLFRWTDPSGLHTEIAAGPALAALAASVSPVSPRYPRVQVIQRKIARRERLAS